MFNLVDAVELHPRRRWPALVGFAFEFAALSTMLVMPLVYPNGLPEAFRARRIFLPAPNSPSRPPAIHQTAHLSQGLHVNPLIVVPRTFTFNPEPSRNPSGESAAPPFEGPTLGAEDGVSPSIMADVMRPLPITPRKPPVPPRQSRMMEGNLVHRVAPQYPTMAKQLGIQGTVLIRAVISRTGTIEQAEVLSGHPWLSPAALNAVREWKYRPYYLNGQPVEVETQITVNFVLAR